MRRLLDRLWIATDADANGSVDQQEYVDMFYRIYLCLYAAAGAATTTAQDEEGDGGGRRGSSSSSSSAADAAASHRRRAAALARREWVVDAAGRSALDRALFTQVRLLLQTTTAAAASAATRH